MCVLILSKLRILKNDEVCVHYCMCYQKVQGSECVFTCMNMGMCAEFYVQP